MHPPHAEIPLATPLAAFLRVPLSWYHSSTQSFFDDESHAMIRRVYTHPSQQHAKRHFCGFCGTPLSYWSERPAGEAEYMNVTLGSLLSEDLRDARREEIRQTATKRRAAMLVPTIAVLAPVMLLFIAAPLPSIVFGSR